VTAVSSLMDRLLDLSKNSIQYGNSMCPSMIRKLKVIVYFRVRETLRNLECDKGGYEQNFIYNSPYMAILKTVSALIVASFTMMSNTGQ
jgi:hypothetical protein